MCSKNERILMRDLSDHSFQIFFNGWWASINVVSKRPLQRNNSRHSSSWRFYLHCGSVASGSPETISIICHQVLRHPTEHGTSSMGKDLLAKAYIAKWNKATESDVSELPSLTVNEKALAVLKRQGSRSIAIVSV
jgi:hypothetical protein